jgi:COMPASS component SWD3
VDALTVNPTSESLFATGSHDKTIKLWDANKPAKALNVITGNKEGVWCLNYSADGKKLLSASSDGFCKIFDAKSGKCTNELTAHVGAKVRTSKFSH